MIIAYWIFTVIFWLIGFIGTVASVIVFYANRSTDARTANDARAGVKIFFPILVLAVAWPVVLPVVLLWGVFKALTFKEDKS